MVNGSMYKKLIKKGYTDQSNELIPPPGVEIQARTVFSPESRRDIKIDGKVFKDLLKNYNYDK